MPMCTSAPPNKDWPLLSSMWASGAASRVWTLPPGGRGRPVQAFRSWQPEFKFGPPKRSPRMEAAVGLKFRDVGECLWDLRRRKRMKQRLGVASWQSGKATEMDADDQLEADWGTF